MTDLSLALLTPTGLPGVTWLYALALAALAVFWWVRVAREARRGRIPRQGWWFVPGLLSLLLAGPTELPALFGVGVALLLLAEFWPLAYVRPRRIPGHAPERARRPRLGWPLFGLVGGFLLLSSALMAGEANLATVLSVVAALVAGVGGLLAATLLPRPARRPPNEPGFALRWQTPLVPEWPELSLSLTGEGAQLTNTSPQSVRVAGWSPARTNAWLRLRTAEGTSLDTLPAGQSAYLPLQPHASGLRVWYVLSSDPQRPRLFRADWTPPVAQPQRVLN